MNARRRTPNSRYAVPRGRALCMLLCLTLLASGCGGWGTLETTHAYVLVRSGPEGLVPVHDDDLLYTLFEQQVTKDAYLKRMLDLFEHTTEAFGATNMSSRFYQTLSNHPVIVLDSHTPGVLRDIVVHSDGREVRIERALGLGTDDGIDLPRGREAFATASAFWLLELAGVSTEGAEQVPLDRAADAAQALSRGLAAANDALRADAADSAGAYGSADGDARRQAIQDNAYACRPGEGQTTVQRLSRAEAVRTPGVVATFFYRLLRQADIYYPQRYMLWFLHYAGPEMPLAKTLRVCQRLASEDQVDMESFIAVYVGMYPAEYRAVLALADEVLGPQEAVDERAP